MAPYQRIQAWRRSHDLTLAVYRITDGWPNREMYGLTSQIRRAAASVPTNLVEGMSRRGPRELRHFLNISLGSLGEVSYLLHLARDLGYVTDEDYRKIDALRRRAGFLLWRLYDSISVPTG